MKIALVFDPITQAGGAEQLLWELADRFTDAPIFSAIVNPDFVPERFKKRIVTSWLQKFPLVTRYPKPYLFFLPLAYESFDFSAYDKVISITTLFAKSVITQHDTLHIGYINSPPRFLYSKSNLRRYISNYLLKSILFPPIRWLKSYDQIATKRPDILLANSQNIKTKIKKNYSLDSDVVYPFAKDLYFAPKQPSLKVKNQFVIVSRLEKWKRVDYVVKAFNARPQLKLIIIGTGTDKYRLENMAAKNIIFTGWIPDKEVVQAILSSQALIMPQEEDFGITAIESQALFTPVIALNRGGTSETVLDGQTGIHFASQTQLSLLQAIDRFNQTTFVPDKLRQNALKYRRGQFLKSIEKYL